ncbi:hypothetical protein [Amycolatopsis cihanbeyliensis]|uniref:Uncharacterized protein n=1 Tax=Amycolatopsis cihanbeyliensis TaxID=1128664 RepID=A0A542DLS5_AMYCI|nr:hypothetical protein [Amycolatopsis cihanbeyliensis]TQJ04037.1 hypothetical protein FB471_3817 [Amycolatopsis cihanbeyliensis]
MVARGRAPVRTVLIVVALLVPPSVAWAAWGSGANPNRPDIPTAEAEPSARRPGSLPTPLVQPPGDIQIERDLPFSRLAPLKLFAPTELNAMRNTGVAHVDIIMTMHEDIRFYVYWLLLADGAEPAATLHALDDIYAGGGHEPVEPTPPGVLARRSPEQADLPHTTYHAHYVRGRSVLRVDAIGDPGTAVGDTYLPLLREQVATFPPGEPSW